MVAPTPQPFGFIVAPSISLTRIKKKSRDQGHLGTKWKARKRLRNIGHVAFVMGID